jgi:putative nucleotide binding protein
MAEHGRRRHERHETVVYVLDYMRSGNQMDKHVFHRTRPVAQVIGDTYFTLLEVSPKVPDLDIKPGDRLELDVENSPVKVDSVISYEDLTALAKDELPKVLEKIILDNEKLFVEFFNQAGPLTLKLHALELIPGVGKKTLRQILDERKKKPFESLKDVEERGGLKAPVKMLAERIMRELQSLEEKYFLFVYPDEQRVKKMAEKPVYLGYLEKFKLRSHETGATLPGGETLRR